MTATAAPRWPADAPLLRQVITRARAEGWRSVDGLDRMFGLWEWRLGDKRVILRARDDNPVTLYLKGGGIALTAKIGRAEYAVDLLVDSGWLPEHLHRKYKSGRADGYDAISSGLRDCAEFGEIPSYAAESLRLPLDYARTYWLAKLGKDDAQARIGDRLDGLLDREPWVRRSQVYLIVDAVAGEVTAS